MCVNASHHLILNILTASPSLHQCLGSKDVAIERIKTGRPSRQYAILPDTSETGVPLSPAARTAPEQRAESGTSRSDFIDASGGEVSNVLEVSEHRKA